MKYTHNKKYSKSKSRSTSKRRIGNKRHHHHRHHKYFGVGGSSFEQKGVAAQLRPSTPHNSTLRKKLNEIVHSGDFYESKERNSFLNLDNDFDPQAQTVLNEAVDYIKNNKDLSVKIKNRVLQGIAPVTTTTNPTIITTTGYHKTSTKRRRIQTPTKKNTVTSTMTKHLNSTQNQSQRRTRRKFKI